MAFVTLRRSIALDRAAVCFGVAGARDAMLSDGRPAQCVARRLRRGRRRPRHRPQFTRTVARAIDRRRVPPEPRTQSVRVRRAPCVGAVGSRSRRAGTKSWRPRRRPMPPAPIFKLSGIAASQQDGAAVLTAIVIDNGVAGVREGGRQVVERLQRGARRRDVGHARRRDRRHADVALALGRAGLESRRRLKPSVQTSDSHQPRVLQLLQRADFLQHVVGDRRAARRRCTAPTALPPSLRPSAKLAMLMLCLPRIVPTCADHARLVVVHRTAASCRSSGASTGTPSSSTSRGPWPGTTVPSTHARRARVQLQRQQAADSCAARVLDDSITSMPRALATALRVHRGHRVGQDRLEQARPAPR